MKKLIAILLLFCTTAHSAQAFVLPNILPQPIALATGAGAGYVVHEMARDGGFESLGRTIFGVLIGGTTYFFAHKFFYGFTAKGKFTRANDIAVRVARNKLISGSYPTAEAVRAQAAKKYFGSNWPLVKAHEELVQTLKDLAHAQRLATDARDNAGTNDALTRNCVKLLAMLQATSERAAARTQEVLGDGKEYDRQYRRFQEWQKIQLQEQSVSLQHSALLQNGYHHWSDRYNDRRKHQDFLDIIAKTFN